MSPSVKNDPLILLSPGRVVFVLLAAIFGAEFFAMSVLRKALPAASSLVQDLVDVSTLTALISPLLWFLIVRPLRQTAVKERHRFASIVKNAIASLFTFDDAGRIESFNAAAERLFGYKEGDAIGRSIQSMVPDAMMVKRMAGQCMHQESLGLRSDGSSFPIDLMVNKIEFLERTVYFAAIRDISERKQLEATVVEQQAKMLTASKMASLGEMAGAIAHEINNPLAAIQLLSELSQKLVRERCDDQDKILEILARLESTGQRIAKIVTGLRSFARDGRADPFVSCRLSELVSETMIFCEERFRAHGIALAIEPMAADLAVMGRFTQLSQVLLNLLNNALDAVDELAEKWVRITVVESGEFVEIAITDSGKGIPLDIASKIFKPFFTTKSVGKGTGLGLSISQSIIAEHNGSVVVDEQCANTRFVIRLPVFREAKNTMLQ